MRSVPLARRSVLVDPRRLVTTVAGVGTALALILLLSALWAGLRAQAGAYADNAGANLIVAEAGTRTIEVDSSVLPAQTAAAVESVPGVRAADPVLYRYTVVDLHGRRLFTRLVGSVPGGLGGPWRLLDGRLAADGEVVIDRTLAREHDLAIGDQFSVLGTPLEIVGLSGGTRSWMTNVVFTTHSTAADLLRVSQSANLVLVQADQPAQVAERIRSDLGVAVLTPAEVAANDREVLTGVMAAPMGLMIAVAFAAGTLVTALSVYSSVVERVREYGVVKAIGASGWRMLRTVVGQTLVVTVLAGAASYGIYRAAAWAVVTARPQFAVQLEPSALAAVFAAAVLMALLGAVAPLLRIVRLDPATVYRG
ncbi:MAG TPA: ABC transporter permease, partial [Jiangellaceae bacterium]|nr:ABC transporter permease [Jiangellaceae bacterium]